MTNAIADNNNEVTLGGKIVCWLFGLGVFAAGIVNTFWGEPAGFGIFLMLLAFVYFLPVKTIFKNFTGISLPIITLRILLALLLFGQQWV